MIVPHYWLKYLQLDKLEFLLKEDSVLQTSVFTLRPHPHRASVIVFVSSYKSFLWCYSGNENLRVIHCIYFLHGSFC
jgi:hypothetical protein